MVNIAMKTYQIILIGAALVLAGIWLGKDLRTGDSEVYPSAVVLKVPVPIYQIALTDHRGQRFTVRRLARKWTFMFFGYTHCPDICPMALVDLNAVYQNLSERGDLIFKEYNVDTQFIFVTVDPQRDTKEQLKKYVPYFNRDFLGLTADPDMIAKLAHPLGVAYGRVQGSDSADEYLVDHSASFLLVDPLGRLRATFPPPHDPKQIAEDFRKIRNRYAAECCISPEDKK